MRVLVVYVVSEKHVHALTRNVPVWQRASDAQSSAAVGVHVMVGASYKPNLSLCCCYIVPL